MPRDLCSRLAGVIWKDRQKTFGRNIPGLIIDSSGSLWLPNTYLDHPGQKYFNTNYPFITVFVGLVTPTDALLGLPQAPSPRFRLA